MNDAFFIVGPTASGKSELAVKVARRCDAEIVGADAFQLYRGLDLLTAKPEKAILARVPHHLLGAIDLNEEVNAEKFRVLATTAICEVNARNKLAIVVGGSGFYIKALTDGLSPLPSSDSKLREQLAQLNPSELHSRLRALDPETARAIDRKNPRRLIRAIEICLLTGRRASEVVAAGVPSGRRKGNAAQTATATTDGVFVFREREELYDRINRRVEAMFADGVVDEVRALEPIGPTANQTLGLREIRELIAGKMAERECITKIQQATRRYAKRQLTWFRRQTNFLPLNLSRYGQAEAIEWILREARLSFAHQDD
jgi:tRNA dimethylallyltransferase